MLELIIYLRNAHPSYSASPTNSAHQHQLDLAGQNIRRKLQATTPSTYVPPQSASFQLYLLHQLCCSSAEARSSTVSSASHSIISLLDKTPTHLYLKKTASMFPPQSAPISASAEKKRHEINVRKHDCLPDKFVLQVFNADYGPAQKAWTQVGQPPNDVRHPLAQIF